ncbi:hypothetical protein GCM10012275_59390 [Longimycelium tulufanense]|uniref:Uncharacterized protein n=1 Tax=Longimycelium tulufanense TaxID=907463 RepID=A0A8J3FWW0_9PSEU|nr:hypothetical protein [Longimycelium tulufanense]GGM80881.1 hypothetical protein GCM10012275_59390 [Longimycelium tulufanense]
MQRRYGDHVDFVEFFAGLGMDQLRTVTVGELVSHIESCLRQAEGGSAYVAPATHGFPPGDKTGSDTTARA